MKSFMYSKKYVIASFIGFILLIIIGFFMFQSRRNNSFNFDNSLEFQENTNITNNSESEKNEDTKEEFIYVHIIGEVKNCGLIKLHERW